MSDAAARERRAKQTVNNLVYSLLATAAVVLVMVLVTPRPNTSLIKHVDYQQIAKDASAQSGLPIVSPAMISKGWFSNAARWNTGSSDKVDNWYVGFVGPQNQYIGLTQAFKSNPTWVAVQLTGDTAAGAVKIGGYTWTVWKALNPSSPRLSKDYALVTDIAVGDHTDQVLIYGTAPRKELVLFAGNVARNLNVLYPR
jgi:hypothetical protein